MRKFYHLDEDRIVKTAIEAVEQNGIVFLDEQTNYARSERQNIDVSREGVQRYLAAY